MTTETWACDKCGGNGWYTKERYISDSLKIGRKTESFSYSEDEVYGCERCGGSGSCEAVYDTKKYSGVQDYLSRNLKLGSGKIKVNVTASPCSTCGKFHDRALGRPIGKIPGDTTCYGEGSSTTKTFIGSESENNSWVVVLVIILIIITILN